MGVSIQSGLSRRVSVRCDHEQLVSPSNKSCRHWFGYEHLRQVTTWTTAASLPGGLCHEPASELRRHDETRSLFLIVARLSVCMAFKPRQVTRKLVSLVAAIEDYNKPDNRHHPNADHNVRELFASFRVLYYHHCAARVRATPCVKRHCQSYPGVSLAS